MSIAVLRSLYQPEWEPNWLCSLLTLLEKAAEQYAMIYVTNLDR